MIVLAQDSPFKYCCTNCKSGACMRIECPGDECRCAEQREWHGHVPPEEVFANIRKAIDGMG